MHLNPVSGAAAAHAAAQLEDAHQRETIARTLADLAEVIEQTEKYGTKRARDEENAPVVKWIKLEQQEQETEEEAVNLAHEAALAVLAEEEPQASLTRQEIEDRWIAYALENRFFYDPWRLKDLEDVDDLLLFETFAAHTGPCSYLVTKLFLEADPASIEEEKLRRLLELISDEEYADYILQKHQHLEIPFFSTLSRERQELAQTALKKFRDIEEELAAEELLIEELSPTNLSALGQACRRYSKWIGSIILFENQESKLYRHLYPNEIELSPDRVKESLQERMDEKRTEDNWVELLLQEVSRDEPIPSPEQLPHGKLYHLFKNIERGDTLSSEKMVRLGEWYHHPITELTTSEIIDEALQENWEQFCEQLEEGDVISYALEKESNDDLDSFPREALGACLNGGISFNQFVSAVILWEALSAFGPGARNEEQSVHYLELTASCTPDEFVKNKSFPEPERKVLDRFAALMKDETISDSEKRCLVIRVDDNAEIPSLLMVIRNSGFDFLGRFNSTQASGGYCVIPSFTMIEMMLKAEFGDHAVMPRPVFGHSSKNDILESVAVDRHDMGLGYPGISLPGIVDGAGSDRAGYSYSMHDIFHCRLASAVPKNHRQFFVGLSSLFHAKAEASLEDEHKKSWSSIAWNFVDLINHDYLGQRTWSEASVQASFRVFLMSITFENVGSEARAFVKAYLKENEPELRELLGPTLFVQALQICED